jgi:hypothetical protein
MGRRVDYNRGKTTNWAQPPETRREKHIKKFAPAKPAGPCVRIDPETGEVTELMSYEDRTPVLQKPGSSRRARAKSAAEEFLAANAPPRAPTTKTRNT